MKRVDKQGKTYDSTTFQFVVKNLSDGRDFEQKLYINRNTAREILSSFKKYGKTELSLTKTAEAKDSGHPEVYSISRIDHSAPVVMTNTQSE